MISSKKKALYQELIQNPLFQIEESGEIFKQINGGGIITDSWKEQSTYVKENRRYFKYQQVELSVHLTVLAKFHRLPENTEMALFKDGDISNTALHNLEIVSKSGNSGKKLQTYT